MNVIDRARERIERDGWWQGDSKSAAYGSDPVCIVTAIGRETHDTVLKGRCYGLIAQEANLDNFATIPTFNDDPSTSLEDVLLVMKRASARLDEEARP